jgi:hypothetical protein
MLLSSYMVIPSPKEVRVLAEEIERLELQLAVARRKWNALFGIAAAPPIPAESRRFPPLA